MEVLSVTTGQQWSSLTATGDTAAVEAAAATERQRRTVSFLTDVLNSDNLVVLTGLGTSLCVKGTTGDTLGPTMSDLWAAARAGYPQFADVVARAKYSPAAGAENLEELLSNCHILHSVEPQDRLSEFIGYAEKLIVSKCSFVQPRMSLPVHEAFIRALARRSSRKPRLKIFTLNYDLCFETAASNTRFVVIDGFSHTQPQQFDSDYFSYDIVRRDEERPSPDYIANVFHLYKLHGSIDWAHTEGGVIRSNEPVVPAIVYPRYTKFEASYTPPFLEMISRFQSALRQPNTGLLVVGFGFRDIHVTQPILASVRSNVALKAAIVNRSIEPRAGEPLAKLEALVQSGDTRLLLAKGTFEELVPLLPDLVGQSEADRHYERTQAAGVQP